MTDRTCSIDGCDRKHYGRGWCETHYARWRRKGTTYRAPKLSPEESFWSKVDKDGPVSRLGSKCWNWTGVTRSGYGWLTYRGRMISAHVLSTRLVTERDVTGILDHMCHNRSCVNPDHLRPATNKQNGENRSGLNVNNTSGVKGVSWNKRSRCWVAYVTHNGKRIHVGRFRVLNDAEAAVIAKRNELYTHNDLDRVA